MDTQTKVIPVELSDGTLIRVEVTALGEQRVAYQSRPFKEVTSTIKNVTNEIASTLQSIKEEIKPDKISIKLGLEIAIESGQITALIAKGSSKANFEISMEWNK
jgi:hypothetical protein